MQEPDNFTINESLLDAYELWCKNNKLEPNYKAFTDWLEYYYD